MAQGEWGLGAGEGVGALSDHVRAFQELVQVCAADSAPGDFYDGFVRGGVGGLGYLFET
jgi:hypothetical protein